MAKQKSDPDQRDPQKKPFTPETLDQTVIVIPLLNKLNEERNRLYRDPKLKRVVFPVIIELNLEYPEGREGARDWVTNATQRIIAELGSNKDSGRQGINAKKSEFSQQYIFAVLEGDVIREMVRWDNQPKIEPKAQTIGANFGPRAIYHIWPDFEIRALMNNSIRAMNTGAAHTSFSAYGEGIVWAVLDSGIEATHPHFALHDNLKLKNPLTHTDFTKLDSKAAKTFETARNALKDDFGHGTHVAGIIAGGMKISREDEMKGRNIRVYTRQRDENGEVAYNERNFTAILGKAPKCKLLSLKVLDENGNGLASNLIAAIAMIQEINRYSRRLLIHGVNISVGYNFEFEWQIAGQTPLHVEINRLVSSGVIVVAADGHPMQGKWSSTTYHDDGISEPGNAELAISVASILIGSTPDNRGQLFSPKKLHIDESEKPDIIAPVEKVISCAAGKQRQEMKEKAGNCDYLEESGTSIAAARVSGSIAAFLSVRNEFIGQPEKVKRLFTSSEGIKLLNSYQQLFSLEALNFALYSLAENSDLKENALKQMGKQVKRTEEAVKQIGNQIKRTKVFVSYSHHDKDWLERLRVHLSPLQREGILDFWDDTRIRTGERWKDKIIEALKSARVAVLLVSADFLSSDFIQSNELPELLAGAENEGVIIMSVIIKPSLYHREKNISKFQAVNPPDKPLINLSKGKQEAYWLKLAEDIAKVFDEHSPTEEVT